jgi:hypothetical protein
MDLRELLREKTPAALPGTNWRTTVRQRRGEVPAGSQGATMKPNYRISALLSAAALCLAFATGPAQAQGRAARDIPYATSFGVNFSNSSGAFATSQDAVPSNKRLVIEYVSVTITAQPGDRPALYLNDSVNGAGHAYWIPLTLDPAANGAEIWRGSQLVKLNHDGDGTHGPAIQCNRSANAQTPMSCFATISGYLVDK